MAYVGVSERKRVIEHGDESVIIGRGVTGSKNAGAREHHRIILQAEVVLTEVGLRVNVMNVEASHMGSIIIGIIGIKSAMEVLES